MAAPLFVPTEDALKSKLRLSAVPDSALDTQAIIDEAILRARVRFFRALGTARVQALLATAYTESPTTDDQVMRALAATTEVKMVYCALLRMLPNTFMDASGDVDARWNEEAPVRERTSTELDSELKRCENEIQADLLSLEENETDPCESEIQAYNGTPDLQTSFPPNTPRVGTSLNPLRRRTPLG